MSEPPGGNDRADPDDIAYVLRLYVAGTTQRSNRAIENLRRVCEERLEGRYVIEVIDIYQQAEAAREDQVICAPTLVRIRPEPVRRIIGDLSDEARVLRGLDLPAARSGSRDGAASLPGEPT